MGKHGRGIILRDISIYVNLFVACQGEKIINSLFMTMYCTTLQIVIKRSATSHKHLILIDEIGLKFWHISRCVFQLVSKVLCSSLYICDFWLLTDNCKLGSKLAAYKWSIDAITYKHNIVSSIYAVTVYQNTLARTICNYIVLSWFYHIIWKNMSNLTMGVSIWKRRKYVCKRNPKLSNIVDYCLLPTWNETFAIEKRISVDMSRE